MVERMIMMLKIAKEYSIEDHFAIFDIITFTLFQTVFDIILGKPSIKKNWILWKKSKNRGGRVWRNS